MISLKDEPLSPRIQREKRTVERMIRLYCCRKEGNTELCADCAELLDYAWRKLERCPLGDRKRSCRKCVIHCYRPVMRERMRTVMRYAGPRMFLYYPLDALCHLWKEL